MGDYTPTTEEVREYVANGGEYRPWVAPDEAVESARTAAFNRWLAQHDREVAAKALREAALLVVDAVRDEWPHQEGRREAAEYIESLILDRADRIERGDDG